MLKEIEHLNNKTKAFYKDYIYTNKKLVDIDFYPLESIFKMNDKYLFHTKYGNVLSIPSEIKRGKCPRRTSAIDKTKYFINEVEEKFGKIKYDLSKFVFKGLKYKSTLICKKHGYFSKLGDNMMKDLTICPKCSFNNKNTEYYSINNLKEDWKDIPCIVYIIKLYNKDESFYKVGVTTKSLKTRFQKGSTSCYKWEVIQKESNSLYECIIKEHKILEEMKKYKYLPRNYFGGYNECLSINPLDMKNFG